MKLDDGSGGAGAVFGVTNLLGSQSYHMDNPALCSGLDASTFTSTTSAPSGAACSAVTSKVDKLTISCPSTKTCSGNAEATTKRMIVDCVTSGSSQYCKGRGTNDAGLPIDIKGNPDKKNWFFSMQVFEASGGRQIFSTSAAAIAYDQARLSENDLVSINAFDADPTVNSPASPDSRGWRMFFDHGAPSTPSTTKVDSQDVMIFRGDERVASNSAVEASCAFWNTMQPGIPPGAVDSTTGCPVQSPCKASKKQISYLYGANPATGDRCLLVDGSLTRVQQSETLVPPHIGKLVAYVASGQVSFGLTSVRIPQGGSNISLGETQDATANMGWIPIDRTTEACRHAPKTCAVPPCPTPVCK